MMTVEGVRTRASTSEALLTLAVPLEQAVLISAFLSRIGDQVGVAFADVDGTPLVQAPDSEWSKLPPLTQSAIKLCGEPAFQNFVAVRLGNGSPPSEDVAAAYTKKRCGVTTRKDLETVDGARERFAALMAEYREWFSKQS